MKPSRGFSLIEVIIAMVLLGLLAVIGTHMISGTTQTSFLTTHNTSSGSQLRWAMERMAREIREVQFGAFGYSFTTKSANVMAFTKENLATVTFTQSGTTLTMTQSGVTATLSNQIAAAATTDCPTTFGFAYLDQLGGTTSVNEDVRFVQITMSVTNSRTGKTECMRTRIFLRNAQMSA